MRIVLGVLAVASGAIAFLSAWATLFLLEAGGTVRFLGVPLTLPGAVVLLIGLTGLSIACIAGTLRGGRQHA